MIHHPYEVVVKRVYYDEKDSNNASLVVQIYQERFNKKADAKLVKHRRYEKGLLQGGTPVVVDCSTVHQKKGYVELYQFNDLTGNEE